MELGLPYEQGLGSRVCCNSDLTVDTENSFCMTRISHPYSSRYVASARNFCLNPRTLIAKLYMSLQNPSLSCQRALTLVFADTKP